MSKATKSSKPTHELFSVTRKEGAEKGRWQKIGACWEHDDGEGFNVKLEYLPLAGGDLVIRKWKPKPEAAATEGGAA